MTFAPHRQITCLAIANRGEIAVRIARTAREMGIESVALVGPDDEAAPHARLTDHRRRVSSYLDIDGVLAAAVDAGADAIHPGYGFLSENADFADACAKAGLTFIGPSADAIRIMGDKIAAKTAARHAGVETLPGSSGALNDMDAVVAAIDRIGLPAMVKAAAGGGGKGMRIIRTPEDIAGAVDGARAEAASAFGDDRLFVERFVDRPRHVEVQILADTHGTVLAIGDRDCSLQRRHQKIIEEAPAPGLLPGTRAALHSQSIALARAVGYRGAGTVEFMVDQSGSAYFLEMNTRLQVEHPVTEAIAGIDLVYWMVRIAEGASLPTDLGQNLRGHAVEARLYAEDSQRGFLPSTGRLTRVEFPPQTPNLRIDSGVASGQRLGSRYDPMIAKIIAWGTDRQAALQHLRTAVVLTWIEGVATNRDLLLDILDQDLLALPTLSTAVFGETYGGRFAPTIAAPPPVVLSAAAAVCGRERAALGLPTGPVTARCGTVKLTVGPEISHPAESLRVIPEGDLTRYHVALDAVIWSVVVTPSTLPDRLAEDLAGPEGQDRSATRIVAPLGGTVTAILVAEGEWVEIGSPVIRIEAMKMDHSLTSQTAGTVRRVRVTLGATVTANQSLIEIEATP